MLKRYKKYMKRHPLVYRVFYVFMYLIYFAVGFHAGLVYKQYTYDHCKFIAVTGDNQSDLTRIGNYLVIINPLSIQCGVPKHDMDGLDYNKEK